VFGVEKGEIEVRDMTKLFHSVLIVTSTYCLLN